MTVNKTATQGGQAAALPAQAGGNVIYLPCCALEPVQNRKRGRLPGAVTKLQTVRQERDKLRQRMADIEARMRYVECACNAMEVTLAFAQEELQAMQALLTPPAKTRGGHESR